MDGDGSNSHGWCDGDDDGIAVDISHRNRQDSNINNENDDDASTVYTSCSNQQRDGASSVVSNNQQQTQQHAVNS
jgi:hypothetical protein